MGNYDEKFASAMLKFINTMWDIGSFLKYFRITGFYRGFESVLSSIMLYMANRSGLKIELSVFDGVEVILFDPIKTNTNKPAIVYFHGGGFKYFNPRFYSIFLAEVARQLNILIVAVNYRKAPEHPFPAGITDCLNATKFFFKNAGKFHVDPSRIALMGDSAGGNFVVSVGYHLAKLAKIDSDLQAPKILVPLCPSLQIADLNTPSMRDVNISSVLTKEDCCRFLCEYAFGELSKRDLENHMNMVSTNSHLSEETVEKVRDNIDWTQYLTGPDYNDVLMSTFKCSSNQSSDKFSKLAMDPLFSPLSALDNAELGLLPPVFLMAASHDPLRDDSKLLAARLDKIGCLGGYREFDHFHVSFFFNTFGFTKSVEAFNDLIGIFHDNDII